ncbi:isochorismate synthase [Microbulbifer sp. MLAF003]|uniref:isochorismate synthase n=1 Tax=Microbulbifer sp. MLAF003 TaxID=3032582 RepID=UPI0024AD3446|nr:isochorismate synthase [Microbulbifer sp. MLAF003]WHI49262.1 isochorismate synthase [Microbulbifer sp. MLAF003]
MKGRSKYDGLEACLQEAKSRVSQGQPEVLASFSFPCHRRDPIGLFAANYRHERITSLWGTPSSDFYALSFGSAYEFSCAPGKSWSEIQTNWQKLQASSVVSGGHQPILCGGFAFDYQKDPSTLWQDFPSGVLTLPELALYCEADHSYVVINLIVTGHTDCSLATEQAKARWQGILSRNPDSSTNDNLPLVESDFSNSDTDQMDWQQGVVDAVESIKRNEFQKVVLARSEALNADCCPGSILGYLQESYPDAYLFAFSRGKSCFLGASPERLAAGKDGRISTVALAGSAPRGKDPAADYKLGLSLLDSDKDRFEHDLVVQHLLSILRKHCHRVAEPEPPQLCKLKQIQHLLTPLEGLMKDRVNLLDILSDLHPSAAVGGLPRRKALKYIRENEGLDRGWYAGPVGWLNAEGEGEFAVALRSALFTPGRVTLFAGCGLVEASLPTHEYRESCIKMRVIRDAIRSVSLVAEAAE